MAGKMLQFVKLGRAMPRKREASARRADFREIFDEYKPAEAAAQSSRCSQCGVPFCQVALPAPQQHPRLAEADGRRPPRGGLRDVLRDQQLAGDLRPHLPAGPAVRRQLRDRAVRPRHRDDRLDREVHHRHGLGARLGQAASSRARERAQSVGIIGAGPAGLAAAEQLRAARAIRSTSTTATTASAA